MMNLRDYYCDISCRYPEIITKAQFEEICNICAQTALAIERKNEIPYSNEVIRLLHRHNIRLDDALMIKFKREFGYRDCDEYRASLATFITDKLYSYPDAMTTKHIVEITGFQVKTICKWGCQGILSPVLVGRKNIYPKPSVISFMASTYFVCMRTCSRAEKQTALLSEFANSLLCAAC